MKLFVSMAAAAMWIAVAGAATAAPIAECAPGCQAPAAMAQAARNKAIVLAFYRLALQQFQPEAAFRKYTDSTFVEHSQDSTGSTREDAIRLLERLIKKFPHPRWEIVRTAAERDLVFMHTRFTPDRSGPEIAVVEIFRLKHGRIVEHWDVIAGPPDRRTNPASRF